jgi:hypothetical protein
MAAARWGLVVAVAGGLAVGISQAQAPGFTPREESPEDFPEVPGREETFYACTACHNFELVAAQGMRRARWDETLDLMVTRFNMPKLEGKERELVLDYLARAFPEQEPARGFQNPFLKN